jgi:hypothetical protein
VTTSLNTSNNNSLNKHDSNDSINNKLDDVNLDVLFFLKNLIIIYYFLSQNINQIINR